MQKTNNKSKYFLNKLNVYLGKVKSRFNFSLNQEPPERKQSARAYLKTAELSSTDP